jgi:serine/alanine adding enzyme
MSYKFNITDSIDPEQWHQFVLNHPNGNIFQTPEMFEVYKCTKNHYPIVFAVLDESGNILAIAQAIVIKEMKWVYSVFTARAIIQGGPLWVEGEDGIEAVRILMLHFDKIIKKKALYIELRNMWDMSQISFFLKEVGYKYEDHLNFLIDLRKSKDDLWLSLSKSRRKGVESSKRNNLTIEVMNQKEMIPVVYEYIKGIFKKLKNTPIDISIFTATYDILIPKNMARFFLVKKEEKYIGGRIVLLFNKNVYAWYRGSNSESKSLYPNDLMGWDIIERFHDEGYHMLDLGGAGNPNEKYGVRDFKKQFGGKLVNYGRFRKEYYPNLLKFSMKLFQIYKVVKSKYV